MRVLVDTSVWSLALRRAAPANPHPAAQTLRRLIEAEQAVCLIGVILQEVLQGVRDHTQFLRLRNLLRPFPLLDLARADFEAAAQLRNHCQFHGIQAGTIDFLIAAASIRHDCAILTTDRDFTHIARLSSLRLL